MTYVPVQQYIKMKGLEILDSLKALEVTYPKDKKELELAREKFDLSKTPLGALSASLTVLAPFISSLLPGYLNL